MGTIQDYARQTSSELMSTKAQEVALDRLLVDRFKSGDDAALSAMFAHAFALKMRSRILFSAVLPFDIC